MMTSPLNTAISVRKPNGEIFTTEYDLKINRNSFVWKIPILRGFINFIKSMKAGMNAMNYSAELSMIDENNEKEDYPNTKLITAISSIVGGILGVLISIILFIWTPSKLYTVFNINEISSSSLLHSCFEGVVKMIIMLLYMATVSYIPDIHRVFQYHGAEHKTIFCYEHGHELTIENVKQEKRFHPRCGTSLIVISIIISIFVGLFIPVSSPIIRTAIKLLLLPITIGISYELIKICGKYDNLLTKILAMPGCWIQRITTKEPTDDIIEVAIEALKAIT